MWCWMKKFELVADFQPGGNQPEAIAKLTEGLKQNHYLQTLLGVTGSGKTFTMAHVIQNLQRPALVISPNKTLAAQLFSEFRQFFPHNAVHYFVSYYDHYRPEAYMPTTDTFLEKEAQVNEEINRFRLASTTSLLTRRDVIIIASVSCIYGLGDPSNYREQCVTVTLGETIRRRDLLSSLVALQYSRNEVSFWRGNFRARGDVVEVFPAYAEVAYRIELFGDEIDRITEIDTLTGEILGVHQKVSIFPAKHFMTDEEKFEQALLDIETEMQTQIDHFRENRKYLEAQRIESRTRYDIEMLRETGYCNGVENYSRHFTDQRSGEPPYCLIDYFPDDALIFIDESHVAIPQLGGMYVGDRSRKQTLVEYGFRLPCALDNRPLRFEEFEAKVMPVKNSAAGSPLPAPRNCRQVVCVSATPGPYELENSQQIAEQIIRPTGLIDPRVTLHPVEGQIDHLIGVINQRVEKEQRVIVTTLTKRMAEDLSEYFTEAGIRAKYLHSDIDTLERAQILKELRSGVFDVIIGINLLREGLDLPEVSLVAILDADRSGFLRSERSLIQTAGRAARNIDGEVILYADTITPAIQTTIEETERRRKVQVTYNQANNITPATIDKAIQDLIKAADQQEDTHSILAESKTSPYATSGETVSGTDSISLSEQIQALETEMHEVAQNLDFERAAVLRDEVASLKLQQLSR